MRTKSPAPVLETHEIQGIIITGYRHLRYSSYLFLHFDDKIKAQSWLARIAPLTTTSHWNNGPRGEVVRPACALNIAFTYAGIVLLAPAARSFLEEFTQGMIHGTRPRRLGDTKESAPEHWEIGGSSTSSGREIHALLMVQASTPDELRELCAGQRRLLEDSGGVQELVAENGYLPANGKEHFGFADAISEANIAGSPKPVVDDQSCVRAGEFILGYPNEYDQLPATPTVSSADDIHDNLPEPQHAATDAGSPALKDLGRNGSYLVFRKLEQDVGGFRRYFRDHFEEQERELMMAKLVGRWPSGTPLVIAPERDPYQDQPLLARSNSFCYRETDPQGLRCPVGAHIRCVNPRDSLGGDARRSLKSVNRHRVLRRGALYGEKLPEDSFENDGTPRGVLLLCVNTDIKRQFEFLQQTWINNPKFNGLYNDKDPLMGDQGGGGHMTIQSAPVRRRLADLPRFVSVRGGAYFFLPSISALYFLAGIRKPDNRHPDPVDL